MKALIQRVKSSWVKVEDKEIARIGKGYNILLAVVQGDSEQDIKKLVKKILNLRIFPNEEGRLDKNILQVGGEILVVSQFTLAARCKRGNRPDFTEAMPPQDAKLLYEEFIAALAQYIEIKSGEFGAMMEVGIINDGPVTIILDSYEI